MSPLIQWSTGITLQNRVLPTKGKQLTQNFSVHTMNTVDSSLA